MGALLHQAAALQHPDHIGALHRGQAVGDHQCGAAHHGFVQGSLHHFFALRVERAGGFVQQQKRRVLQNSPRNRDALALPARQAHAPVTQIGVKTLGQFADELLRISRFGGSVHILQTGVGSAVADVLDHGAREDHGLLRHDGHALAQVVQAHLIDRHAVQHDAARLRVVKAHEQIKQSGFAGPTGAHHRHGLAGVDLTTELVQRPGIRPRRVMETHRLQLQRRAALRPWRTLWLSRNFEVGLGVQQFHQAFGGAGCTQHVAVHLAQNRKGTGQQDDIEHRLAQLACSAGACPHGQGAHVQAPKQHSTGGHDDETDEHSACADAA